MMYSPGMPRSSYEANELDRIFFLSNAGRPNPNLWPTFHYSVPTLFLCRTLCTALCVHSKVTQRRVAARCAPSPADAGPLYLPLALDLLVNARVEHTCHIVAPDHQSQTPASTSSSFSIGPGLSFREAPLLLPSHLNWNAALDLGAIDNNTVLFVPPLPSSASSEPPRAFHALVVNANKTRATLPRIRALADTPNTPAPPAAPSTSSILALRRRKEVRLALAYLLLKGGHRGVPREE